ncbi:hypothetical protein M0812_22773 [Anaeramoeba flamelloides]|nr:hypothetical protein M0812_22773 [Anaeramoeba flamelloides]
MAAICGINQCRFDKDYFASSVLDTPTILQASFYENTTPVYWNLKLNKIARAHTQVMAEDDCFTTSECSDGSSSTRYNNENYVYESLGENIDCMHPYTSSYSYVRNLVCEDVEYNSCIADSVLTDIEDRNNTMDSAFQEVGIGLAGDSKSTCKNYYTESYGERSDFSYPSHPVVSGAHFDDQNNFFFILTYFEHLSPTAIP